MQWRLCGPAPVGVTQTSQAITHGLAHCTTLLLAEQTRVSKNCAGFFLATLKPRTCRFSSSVMQVPWAPGVLSMLCPSRSVMACQWRSRSSGLRRWPTGPKTSCHGRNTYREAHRGKAILALKKGLPVTGSEVMRHVHGTCLRPAVLAAEQESCLLVGGCDVTCTRPHKDCHAPANG